MTAASRATAQPRRIAVIPARGGSKRIPEKNIRKFRGKPMLAYPLEAARTSGLFATIHVSTENQHIADVAAALGAPVEFKRPPQLADDHTPILPVVRNVLETFLERGSTFDQVWILMACSPLLLAEDLKQAAALYEVSGTARPLLAVARYPAPVEWAFERSASGQLTPLQPGMFSVRSQDLKARYYDAGMFSVFPAARVLQSEGAGDDTSFAGYVMPAHRVTDIDDEEDWKLAEVLFDALAMAPRPVP
jgi:N-acylneuraminate cytidylyltransferase